MTLLELDRVSVTRGDISVLRDITFSLKKGEHLAVIGPNGAGKSFLLRLLSADLLPSEGTITVLGERFGRANLWNLREKVGFISTRIAENFPPRASVMEVVCSGYFGTYGLATTPTAEQLQYAQACLVRFEAPGGERAFETLSDGEQRRVLLCRALVVRPLLVVLDEPCQGLDIRSREALLSAVEELARETSLVYVAHHVEELPRAVTHVIALDRGTVVQFGVKEEVMTSSVLSELFRYPMVIGESGGRYYLDYSKMKVD